MLQFLPAPSPDEGLKITSEPGDEGVAIFSIADLSPAPEAGYRSILVNTSPFNDSLVMTAELEEAIIEGTEASYGDYVEVTEDTAEVRANGTNVVFDNGDTVYVYAYDFTEDDGFIAIGTGKVENVEFGAAT